MFLPLPLELICVDDAVVVADDDGDDSNDYIYIICLHVLNYMYAKNVSSTTFSHSLSLTLSIRPISKEKEALFPQLVSLL